jgi:hypothetical protein
MSLTDKNQKYNMNQSDISELVSLLTNAIKTQDWDLVEESREYLREYQEDSIFEEE